LIFMLQRKKMKSALSVFLFLCTLIGHAQIDVLHYRYEIELNDQSDAIVGKALVTIKFLSDASEIRLDLVSLEEEKGMMAYQVLEQGQRLTSSHKDNVLLFQLAKPAKKGEERTFEIGYMGTPKDGLIISRNQYGDRTFFADNWPNRAHNWIPCNDTPADKASVEFIVTAPSQYRVISNGLLVEEKAIDATRKKTYWKEDTPIATKVMVIGAARFAVTRVDSAYRVPVTAWVYPQDSAKGAYDYALADDILGYMESYIGPYPYKKLANVQSKTIFGGMENANAIFYAENTVTGTRSSEALLAHEIAHQWFGNTATEKSFAHLWLSEGFATYFTNLYIEHKYGADSFQKRLQDERRQVIQFVRTSNHPVVDSTSDYMDLLNANSYQKGNWVLHMLRRTVGEEGFKKSIKAYYNLYKDSNADTRDFQRVVEETTGAKLDTFFRQWLYQPGVPKLDVRWRSQPSKAIEINVLQQSKVLYQLPLEIGIVYKDGSQEVQRINVSRAAEAFQVPVKEKPVKVILDPNTNLLFDGKVTEQ
jgi:aminopeptidase N